MTEFVEKYKLPVVNTLLGLGSIHGDHELFFGMAGMHGAVAANDAITKCDLLINIGARFDDRLTGNKSTLLRMQQLFISISILLKSVKTFLQIYRLWQMRKKL